MMAATSEDFELYELTKENGEQHSMVKAPTSLPSRLQPEDTPVTDDVFNIVMADVSGSMHHYWTSVSTGWQEFIKDKLTGLTKIYVFSTKVQLIRNGTDLLPDDYKGGGTNLTSALKTISCEIHDCLKKYVRVFIVTDGHHNATGPEPDSELALLSVPPGKTVDVFLLAIGINFPVNYSIDIRSKLHNGSANLPSLFWAKGNDEIIDNLMSVGMELNSRLLSMNLSHEGHIVPGGEGTDIIHLGEWLFFNEVPEEMPELSLKVDNEPFQLLFMEPKKMTMSLLLDEVIRQWNSVMIQKHRQKVHVPLETFDLMESLFKYLMEEKRAAILDNSSVKSRIDRKNLKTYETNFATLMNQGKTIIGIEGKYQSEIELAECILKTTVTTRKYDTRNLQMKGHGTDDFAADVDKFRQIYTSRKEAILQLDLPTPEECCRITMTSTLQDLQDPDFLSILEENKFDFLKTFTMTGIPVYAPIRDSSQINPWTLGIKHILVTPFTVLSQRAIEGYVEMGGDHLGAEDKDVMLQENEESTRFNVIIPTVPAAAANVLKPLVRTNLYSLLATFCVLKNPHIVDHNAHIAALGCAWVRSVSDHPLVNRPQFVRERLKNLEATARLYMDREAINRYVKVLVSDPREALMTESKEMYDDRTLKCESMIKPMFYMYLELKRFTEEQVENLLNLLLKEFIGRCLSSYKRDDSKATPFTDFFAIELNDPKRKQELHELNGKKIVEDFKTMHGNFLKSFFTLDDLRVAVKNHISTSLTTLVQKLIEEVTLVVSLRKVKNLKNSGSCGDVKLDNFKSWAQEVQIPEDKIEAAFDPKQVLVYVCEALNCRTSRDRLVKEHASYDECLQLVKKKISQENFSTFRSKISEEVVKFAECGWRKLYQEAHKPLVMPLSPQQVVDEAQRKDIQVTLDTFSQIYRYDQKLKLLRNACQIPGCPHYLVPRRNFNQHIAVEREEQNFPHALHLVSHELREQDVKAVLQEVTVCSHAGRQQRPKQKIKHSSLDYLCAEIKNLLDVYKTDQIQVSPTW